MPDKDGLKAPSHFVTKQKASSFISVLTLVYNVLQVYHKTIQREAKESSVTFRHKTFLLQLRDRAYKKRFISTSLSTPVIQNKVPSH